MCVFVCVCVYVCVCVCVQCRQIIELSKPYENLLSVIEGSRIKLADDCYADIYIPYEIGLWEATHLKR